MVIREIRYVKNPERNYRNHCSEQRICYLQSVSAFFHFKVFFAAVRVFLRSMVIVIGPTPPGTGVM